VVLTVGVEIQSVPLREAGASSSHVRRLAVLVYARHLQDPA